MHQHTDDDYISRFKIVDTRFLMFRDLGDIIKEHVKGNKALDYGCGPAKSTLYLKSLGLDAEGVDISERAIKFAKVEDPNGHYNIIKSGEILVDNCYYDLVFASIVFGHVESKQELLEIFKEIARVLKRGGTLIIMEFNKENYENCNYLTYHTMFDENKNLVSGCKVKIQFKDNAHVGSHYLYTDEDFINCTSDAGLTFIKTYNPLGKDSDGYAWLDENTKSPCTIYVSQKM